MPVSIPLLSLIVSGFQAAKVSSSARSPRQDSQLSSHTNHWACPSTTAAAGLAAATLSSSEEATPVSQQEASDCVQLHQNQQVPTGQSQHHHRGSLCPNCLPPSRAATAGCSDQQPGSINPGQPELSHQAHAHEQQPVCAYHSNQEPESHASGRDVSRSPPCKTSATCPGTAAARAGDASAAPLCTLQQSQASIAAADLRHEAACTPVHGCTSQQHRAAHAMEDGLDSCGSNLKRQSNPARFRPKPAQAGCQCNHGKQQHQCSDQAPSIIARSSRSVSLLVSMDCFLRRNCCMTQHFRANMERFSTFCQYGVGMSTLMTTACHMPCKSMDVCSQNTSTHG